MKGVRMARTKYSDRFCNNCNKETRMEIVGEMQGVQGKIWYRCSRCHYTLLLDEIVEKENNGKLDPANATSYKPWQSFQVGQVIFHEAWNDVGKVLNKTKTSDGSQAIIVSFEKLGQRRLIENLKPETPVESEVK